MSSWTALAVDLTAALARLHDAGKVHGALEPRSIYVARAGSNQIVKFVDVRARRDLPRASASVSSHTDDGIMYRAPEQMGGGAAPTAKSDVYAMGVILYELLAGKAPFEALTAAGLVGKILLGDAVHLAIRAPAVDPRLADLIHSAMAYEVAERCSARELHEGLSVWAAEQRRVESLLSDFLGIRPDGARSTSQLYETSSAPPRRVTRPQLSMGVMVRRTNIVTAEPPLAFASIVVARGITPLFVLDEVEDLDVSARP